jgi:hypothetical protein
MSNSWSEYRSKKTKYALYYEMEIVLHMGRCSECTDLSNIRMVHAWLCPCDVRETDMIEVVPSIWVLCCSDAVCMHAHHPVKRLLQSAEYSWSF